MATSKKPETKAPAKRAPSNTTAKAIKELSEKLEEVSSKVENYVGPVTNDAKAVVALRGWKLYLLIGLFVLIGGAAIYNGCNSAKYKKEAEKQKVINAEIKRTEAWYDSAAQEFKKKTIVGDVEIEQAGEAKAESDKAEQKARESETEGIKIRQQEKTNKNETIKKIQNPRTTDRERDAIADELLRAIHRAKVPDSN